MVSLFRITDGTMLNMLTVFIGATIGTLVGGKISERFTTILFIGLGLFVAVTGLQDAMSAHNGLIVLVGLLTGGLIGEAINIEAQLERFGQWTQNTLKQIIKTGRNTVGEALVTSSLLFCVGPLTILGALTNGLTGDAKDLVIKSTLDGVASLALSAALGWGVFLSIGIIAIVQGGLSLSAGILAPLLLTNKIIITELVAAGGYMLIGIGLRLLKLADLKPGNFLPALVTTPLLVALLTWLRAPIPL